MTRRVVYVIASYPQVSQTFVTNEVAELRRQGVHVDVVSLFPGDELGDADPPQLVLSESYRAAGEWQKAARRARALHPRRWLRFRRAMRELETEMGPNRSQVEWRKLPALAAALRAEGVTALHAHFAWNGAAAAMCLARLLDVPWSVTLHANDIFSRTRNLEAKLRDADHLVTVCDYNRRWIEEHHRLERPLHQVVCGVEVPPTAMHSPDVDVVAVGRLVEKKGFDVLIAAAAILRASRPGLTVEIIGDGKLRDELAAQIEALGLHDVVRLRGAFAHDAALERIAAGRVFCLPCRIASDGDRDSMPVVIKEAMARAIPVVASDVVAVPEMVDDSCGALVPPDDPEALAAALEGVLADETRARCLGEAGRRRVLERFTLAGEVAKLAQVFAMMGVA